MIAFAFPIVSALIVVGAGLGLLAAMLFARTPAHERFDRGGDHWFYLLHAIMLLIVATALVLAVWGLGD